MTTIGYCCFAISTYGTQIFESKHSGVVVVPYCYMTTDHKNSVAYPDECLFNCGAARSQLV